MKSSPNQTRSQRRNGVKWQLMGALSNLQTLQSSDMLDKKDLWSINAAICCLNAIIRRWNPHYVKENFSSSITKGDSYGRNG